MFDKWARVLSTSHYKRYNNTCLLLLEEGYADVKIGSINIPHVTIADDLAVLSRAYGSQHIKICDVEKNTNRERYYVNPIKSSYFCYASDTIDSDNADMFMAGDNSNESNTTHLGIHKEVRVNLVLGKISALVEKKTTTKKKKKKRNNSLLTYRCWFPHWK